MGSQFVKEARAVEETRADMGKRLGEVIESVIGDDRISKLFEKAGGHPAEHAGKPTGLIALDMGIISPDTKTALLVAQAAERATQLAESAGKLSEQSKALVAGKKPLDHGAAGYVAHDDPSFKFVGSARDPQILQRAQGTWMTAQMYLNNEISAVNGQIQNPYAVDTAYTLGAKHADGIRREAAELYKAAADMLRNEGHIAAANKLDKVSASINSTVQNGAAPGASSAAFELQSRSQKAGQDLMIVLNDQSYLAPTPLENTLGKLEGLTKKAPAQQPAAAKQARAPKRPSPGQA